jgi:hypothetical protein
MYDHVVDRTAVIVVPLHASAPSVPDLDGAIFRRSHHPFALAVESYASDVAGVSFESQDGGRVCGFDVVEFDGVVARRGEVAFVGGYAETVYL